MRRKSVVDYFDRLCVSHAGNPREFWRAVRPFMHAKKSAPEQCITLKDQERVIRDQNQVAETMNEYSTNITKDLKLDEHLSFLTQSHFPKVYGANGTSPKMNAFDFHPTNFGVCQTKRRVMTSFPRVLLKYLPKRLQDLLVI